MNSGTVSSPLQPWWHKLAFWVIPSISILIVGIIVGTNLDNIREFIVGKDTGIQKSDEGLYVGKEIRVAGLLEKHTDFRVYTHSLLTDDMGTLGLRSSTLNLDLYLGWTSIRGIVKDYYEDKYIIEVLGIEKSDTQNIGMTGSNETGDVIDDFIYQPTHDAQNYFSQAALLFDVEGDWDYQASLEGDVITLQSINGDSMVKVNYFECDASNPNHDCLSLADRFEDAAEFKITSANGDTYYKLPEADAWFVHNDDLYGYFINGANVETIEGLTKNIILPNRGYVEEHVMPHALSLCSTSDHALAVVDKFDIDEDRKAFTINIQGTDTEGQKVICQLSMDLTNDLGATLVSMKVDGEAVDVKKIEEKNIDDDDVQDSQDKGDTEEYTEKQIKITPDNPYIFESSRGHKIIFPSRNISFAPGDGDIDIDIDGVDCYTYTDLTTYGNDENLHSNPSVQIFECAVKDSVSDLGEYLYQKSQDGKKFLIKAVDPQRKEFVNNIEIE